MDNNLPKDIFSKINSIEDISGLVTNKIEESLYLEFKGKNDNSTSTLDDIDKKNISDSISQFSNSDGGVLIFGINTQKPNDFASELVPISNIGDFKKRVMDYLPYSVQPGVDGIESKSITENEGKGFLVLLIPKSYKTPHRSTKSKQYFKRHQNGKFILEHFELEDMFGVRQKPLLKLLMVPSVIKHIKEIEADNKEGFLGEVEYQLFLKNEGRYVAKNPLVILQYSKDIKVDHKPFSSNVSFSDVDHLNNMPTKQLSMEGIVYPELPVFFSNLGIRVRDVIFDKVDYIKINYQIFAEDMVTQRGEINLKFKEQIRW